MPSNGSRRLVGVAAFVVLGVLSSGCGDDSERSASPPRYYADLAGMTADLDAANTAADEELQTALATTPPEAFGDLFARVTLAGADRFAETIEAMEALSPPAAAEAAHDELVAASRQLRTESRATARIMAGLSRTEVEALPVRPEFLAAEERVDVACAAVQRLADSAGADRNLCVGLFAPPQ